MPKLFENLSIRKKELFSGYFNNSGEIVAEKLNEKQIFDFLSKMKGECVKEGLSSTIGTIKHYKYVEIETKTLTIIPIKQIIDADIIIIYWLNRGMVPISSTKNVKNCDWYTPHPDIVADKVTNRTYAPELAKRIRKKMSLIKKLS